MNSSILRGRIKQISPSGMMLDWWGGTNLSLLFVCFHLVSMHSPNAAVACNGGNISYFYFWTVLCSSHHTMKAFTRSIWSKNLVYHLNAMNTPSPTSETWMTCPLVVSKECQTLQLDLQEYQKDKFRSTD